MNGKKQEQMENQVKDIEDKDKDEDEEKDGEDEDEEDELEKELEKEMKELEEGMENFKPAPSMFHGKLGKKEITKTTV